MVQYHRSASNPNLADPASARALLTIDHHKYTNHNGGQLAFGPEGDLYIGVGDGGCEDDPEDNGQNTDTLLGKILRITPPPAAVTQFPHSNPFAGQTKRLGEIWAYGLRNPWRFSFDRATGDLVIGDVGQDLQEEIDFVPASTGAGANYGWSVWEGDRRNKPGRRSPRGVPGPDSPPQRRLLRDHRRLRRPRPLATEPVRTLPVRRQLPLADESVKLSRGRAIGLRATGLSVPSTSSFGEDARGHIYVCSLRGPVYRLAGG